ncbi:transcriptional regulator [Vibrio nigripulchritudo]|uniref:TetR/AcrR family transcriptional regulator C-terminal domain-containing protein n=1 Tax=Vibrio nigripulchritudo TaxID=28173 RepID=UPI001909D8F5|nr:TetR/AcrR family transcriptional regulator C-terminal domain-containing protein [Vibrio nigripulchritudo]BCL72981.1 transcriptional regulator [Vibrio nigripulchritudo]BDU34345.1 transcriptional regulator [Vibrio nigripulchritudo]
MVEKKKTRSELKREAILEAATSAFKKFGVQATSMDKLAQLAGVSKRTVYNHFATKETLVMHLVSDLWKRAMVDIQLEYCPDTPLKAQLAEMLKMELDFIGAREYLDLSRVAFGHLFYNSEELQKEIEKISAQETAIHRWIKAAMDDGKLKALDPEFANGQLHSLIKGSGFWPQLMGMRTELSEEERKTIAEETAEMFLCRYQS